MAEMTPFVTFWLEAYSRVLARDADEAATAAEHYRSRTALFPDAAVELEAVASSLDRYATECRAAAADPSLRTPEYEGSEAVAARARETAARC